IECDLAYKQHWQDLRYAGMDRTANEINVLHKPAQIRQILGKHRSAPNHTTSEYTLGNFPGLIHGHAATGKKPEYLNKIASLLCHIDCNHAVTDFEGTLRIGAESEGFYQYSQSFLTSCNPWRTDTEPASPGLATTI